MTRLASRLESQRELLGTEEATKNAVIMPIINALGYDVFEPQRFSLHNDRRVETLTCSWFRITFVGNCRRLALFSVTNDAT
ncbi:Prophage Lp2 protein 6 [Rhodopirellula islandica]|uniref:Prophage Lp2 protein 6 n=1 Tax=Rhodopirellula islandica TaxID=595434 RepID=A0A0J1BBW2_RHOIS|nr:Prophage Lp2 protein 6 [Rhodopirellula islandica]